MLYVTLTVGGVEKALADWNIGEEEELKVTNVNGAVWTCEMLLPADAADPIPYGTEVILQIGRASSSVNPANPTLPAVGASGFTGGKIQFIGYRVELMRSGTAQIEKFQYKFQDAWGFWFESTIFQKAFVTYNGAASVVAYRAQIVLGMSINALYGAGDTVSGTAATNLMTIRQQLIEIVQYMISVIDATAGSAKIAFDSLTSAVDSTNWDLVAKSVADLKAAGFACLIPDFLPGYVPGSNQTMGTLSTVQIQQTLRAPLDAVNKITCAEAIRRQLTSLSLGNPIVWTDYSTAVVTAGVMTSPPTLRIGTRDNAPAVNLTYPPTNPFGAGGQSPVAPLAGPTGPFLALAPQIKKRDDLIPDAVAFQFRVLTSAAAPQIIYDIATLISGTLTEGIGSVGLLQSPAQFYAGDNPNTTNLGGTVNGELQLASRGRAAQTDAVDMEGEQTISGTISCIAVDVGDPSSDDTALAFWQALFPELLSVSSLALYDATNSPATVVDSTGSPISLETYGYRLLDGQVAPWMSSSSGAGATIQATVTAKFAYTEKASNAGLSYSATAKTVAYHEKTQKITLTNLPGGTYSQVAPGEIIPYGLSAFRFAMENIPQFEGTLVIQENEVTDQVPIGSVLNFTGSRAEWTTMNACVQAVSYRHLTGQTTITFGPPGHLDGKDFVGLIRANRGPRWYYEIGGNLTNSSTGALQLGSNIPKSDASPANAIPSFNFHPQDLPDFLHYNSDYTDGSPGVTHDAIGSASYGGGGDAGVAGAPDVPLIHLADGTGGAILSFAHVNGSGTVHLEDDTDSTTRIIRAALADIPDGFDWSSLGQIKFREVTDCVSIDGTPTTVYRQALVSKYYTSPLGNSS